MKQGIYRNSGRKWEIIKIEKDYCRIEGTYITYNMKKASAKRLISLFKQTDFATKEGYDDHMKKLKAIANA